MSKMFIAIVSVILMAFSVGYAEDSEPQAAPPNQAMEDGIRMDIREGQFLSEPIEVFINQDIAKSANPRLMLIHIPLFASKKPNGDQALKPQVVARNQTKIVNKITYTGTTLLFSLRQYPLRPYEILKQVKPVLIWDNPDDPQEPHQSIGTPTNIGNDFYFIIFVAFVIFCCVAIIAVWSRRTNGSILDLLLGDDGYLSLSRTQVSAWTIVVGGVVFGFGLLMLKVPDIPESLLALMGLSLATGGLKYYAGSKDKLKNAKPKFALSDLICEGDPVTKIKKTSLPKAQMLFWTALMLILFVVKSIADGTLWGVPWEMVTLMGMSQAAYLSPHLTDVGKKKADEKPESDTADGEPK